MGRKKESSTSFFFYINLYFHKRIKVEESIEKEGERYCQQSEQITQPAINKTTPLRGKPDDENRGEQLNEKYETHYDSRSSRVD